MAVYVVQVFVLAENRLLRESLTRILNKKGDTRAICSTAFGPGGVQQISNSAPDVLLSDSAAVVFSDVRLACEVRSALLPRYPFYSGGVVRAMHHERLTQPAGTADNRLEAVY